MHQDGFCYGKIDENYFKLYGDGEGVVILDSFRAIYSLDNGVIGGNISKRVALNGNCNPDLHLSVEDDVYEIGKYAMRLCGLNIDKIFKGKPTEQGIKTVLYSITLLYSEELKQFIDQLLFSRTYEGYHFIYMPYYGETEAILKNFDFRRSARSFRQHWKVKFRKYKPNLKDAKHINLEGKISTLYSTNTG